MAPLATPSVPGVSSTRLGPANLSRVMDTNGISHIQLFNGENQHFRVGSGVSPGTGYQWRHCGWTLQGGRQCDPRVQFIALERRQIEAAEKLYDLLAMPCKDEVASYGRTAEGRHGLQAWQALLSAKTFRNPTSLTNQLLDPHVSSSDPRVVTCVSGKVRK